MVEDKITSVNNTLIKEISKLHLKKNRDEQKLIILEGEKLIEAAIKAELEILYIFSTSENNKSIETDKKVKTIFVNEKVMEKISTTDTPPKILAVAKKPVFSNTNLNFSRAILLENVKDAGNLGTVIRTATAFGIDVIFLCGECVDEYSPKVLRATTGEIFKIRIAKISMPDLINLKKTHKFITTVVNSKNKIEDVDFSNPFILVFGSEANGLTKELKNLSDIDFTLPMKNETESLNLAVSVGICAWEISKHQNQTLA